MSSLARLYLSFLILISWVPFSLGQSVDELENIMKKASSLSEFLKNEELIKEYFNASQKFFTDERFEWKRYYNVLNQLRYAIEKVPGLEARLWETEGIGNEINFASQITTTGRTVDQEKWFQLLSDLKEPGFQLFKQVHGTDAANAKATVNGVAAEILQKEKNVEQQVAGLGKKKAAMERGAFFQQIRALPELKPTAQYLLYNYLNSPGVRKKITEIHPDYLQNFLKYLKDNPQEVTRATIDGEVPGALLSEVKALVPGLNELLASEKNPFPKSEGAGGKSGNEEIRFQPLPRRIHGIFKGMAMRECVGGGINTNGENLTPERWGTIALKDSLMWYVTVSGKYNGFVHVVPLQSSHGLVGSTEFEAWPMNKSVVVPSKDGSLEKKQVFEAWLDRATEYRPGWVGFAIGNSGSFDHASVYDGLEKLDIYKRGRKDISRADLKHIEPMVPQLASLYKREGHAERYSSGKMITELTIETNKEVHVLAPEKTEKSWKTRFEDAIHSEKASKFMSVVEEFLEVAHSHLTPVDQYTQLITYLHSLGLLDKAMALKNGQWVNMNAEDHETLGKRLAVLGFSGSELLNLRNHLFYGLGNEPSNAFSRGAAGQIASVNELEAWIKPSGNKKAEAREALGFIELSTKVDPKLLDRSILTKVRAWYRPHLNDSEAYQTMAAQEIEQVKNGKDLLAMLKDERAAGLQPNAATDAVLEKLIPAYFSDSQALTAEHSATLLGAIKSEELKKTTAEQFIKIREQQHDSGKDPLTTEEYVYLLNLSGDLVVSPESFARLLALKPNFNQASTLITNKILTSEQRIEFIKRYGYSDLTPKDYLHLIKPKEGGIENHDWTSYILETAPRKIAHQEMSATQTREIFALLAKTPDQSQSDLAVNALGMSVSPKRMLEILASMKELQNEGRVKTLDVKNTARTLKSSFHVLQPTNKQRREFALHRGKIPFILECMRTIVRLGR